MVSAILFLASRDPERNVAIVDGLIVGLVILAVTPLVSFYTVDIQRIYPGHGWKFLRNEHEGQGEETWPGVTPFAFGRATEETVKTLVPSPPCRA